MVKVRAIKKLIKNTHRFVKYANPFIKYPKEGISSPIKHNKKVICSCRYFLLQNKIVILMIATEENDNITQYPGLTPDTNIACTRVL